MESWTWKNKVGKSRHLGLAPTSPSFKSAVPNPLHNPSTSSQGHREPSDTDFSEGHR